MCYRYGKETELNILPLYKDKKPSFLLVLCYQPLQELLTNILCMSSLDGQIFFTKFTKQQISSSVSWAALIEYTTVICYTVILSSYLYIRNHASHL